MICFICKSFFLNEVLFDHLKLFHGLGKSNDYECTENNCFQSFKNFSSFKKHVRVKHGFESTNLEHQICSSSNSNCINNIDNCISIISGSKTNTNFKKISDKYVAINQTQKPELNFEAMITNLYRNTTSFVLSLHSKDNLTKKDVAFIQESIVNVITSGIVNIIETFLESEKLNTGKVQSILTLCKNPFQYCNTDYELIKWLTENKYYKNVTEFDINNELSPCNVNGVMEFKEYVSKGTLLPLEFQFQQVFQKDGILDEVLENIRLHTNNKDKIISDFTNGKLFKKKIENLRDKVVIPYFLYIDDLEINNPLGSHSTYQSIAGIYYLFPNFKNISKLENIYLAAIIKTQDLKRYGNDSSLIALVNEINLLEQKGVLIKTKNKEIRVHFILGLILGDNLGLNSILGFSKSFSANHFCRFCKESKLSTQKIIKENIYSLRNIKNYNEDVQVNNFFLTGINENSILNGIKSFHVVENYAVDIMHDLFEGICHYNMCNIILYYIETSKFFSLELFNNRKNLFNYGEIERKNISPVITIEHLRRKRFKMSAREMMTFVHFFALMIGDLIPEDDEVWQFFLNFLKIVETLLSKEFSANSLLILESQIIKHNEKYIQLFNDTLKPKHHLLIHYPSIIKQSGPPRNYWCMRFEAKHKQFKKYAQVTTSRKNVPLTLAKKFQYKFAYYLLTSNNESDVTIETNALINDSKIISYIGSHLNLPINFFQCFTQLDYKGTIYKKGFYVTSFDFKLNLYEIMGLIYTSSKKVYLLLSDVEIRGYDSHYDAYQVHLSSDGGFLDYQIKSICDVNASPLNIIKTINGTNFIRLKEFI